MYPNLYAMCSDSISSEILVVLRRLITGSQGARTIKTKIVLGLHYMFLYYRIVSNPGKARMIKEPNISKSLYEVVLQDQV